jgi:hypothetical protein
MHALFKSNSNYERQAGAENRVQAGADVPDARLKDAPYFTVMV